MKGVMDMFTRGDDHPRKYPAILLTKLEQLLLLLAFALLKESYDLHSKTDGIYNLLQGPCIIDR